MSKYNYSKKYAQKKLYYIKYIIFAVVMDKNEISLRIIGKNGDEPLSPANFDIGQIRFLLDEVENLLYPDRQKRKERPTISYELKEGSVLNVFKTSMQSVLLVSSMLGVIEQEKGYIDRLEVASAQAIENLQYFALRHNYDIEIGTSDKPQRIFKITPTTHYVRRENILVDIECYYYGTLTDAGGKDKANIHLDTKDAGSLIIRTDKEYLAGYQGNPLYKKFGVRVRAKKNILTGDIDKSTLVLVELMDYQPKFDEDYLQGLIRKATPKWRGVNAGEWLANVRGGLA